GRHDTTGDNETCSRSPTDLRGSPAAYASPFAKAAVLWSYDSLTKGGLDYPHSSGCVANMTGTTK
ncbi:MAG: hypothetical protein IJA67_00110, partial [Oscillospiraceae bacterium]|nr:hypothetical protein [Oscillospiraceae bacterium]